MRWSGCFLFLCPCVCVFLALPWYFFQTILIIPSSLGWFFFLSLSLTFFASVPRFLVFFSTPPSKSEPKANGSARSKNKPQSNFCREKRYRKQRRKITRSSPVPQFILLSHATHTHTHTHRQTIIDGRVQANTMDSKQEKKKQKRKKRERNKKKNTPILPMKTCEARKKEQQQQIYCGAGVGPT